MGNMKSLRYLAEDMISTAYQRSRVMSATLLKIDDLHAIPQYYYHYKHLDSYYTV